jgi:hypothetical protein
MATNDAIEFMLSFLLRFWERNHGKDHGMKE